MPSFACKDIGLDCPFQTKADTEPELVQKITDHALKVHAIKTMPADMMAKIKKAIKK